MTDQDHNVLTEFIRLYGDERKKHLKKKPREYLVNLAILCAAKAERERRNKEEYATKYELTNKELQAFHEERDRHLEMSDKLADEVNRLQQENDRLVSLVNAALTARSLYTGLIEATIEAGQADVKLAELGVRFELLGKP
jgi:hypothetical protein